MFQAKVPTLLPYQRTVPTDIRRATSGRHHSPPEATLAPSEAGDTSLLTALPYEQLAETVLMIGSICVTCAVSQSKW